MATLRDPLDELIVDLERSLPTAPPAPAFDEPPPIGDYSILVMSVISRDPAERERLAADPAAKRVMDFMERQARKWRSSSPVEPQK